MSEIAIQVEQLYKQYKLGTVSTGTMVHDLNRWWHKVKGKEDPYQKVTAINDRTQKASGEYVWALQDINFAINKGEVIGIIGKNGAGKSTLLKLLSKVTSPTKGSIKVNGRIASLLEVGTGFHPELTGRENIFLNGAILGMTKSEIKSKFDEIVDFSGVDKYIDTPVKRYSSGMYVRLAFAVAAHLESEILIVDEVLAVGDADFQKKCLGKMKDVSGAGRTVLFVSHNMMAVKTLCSKGILLKNGSISVSGEVNDVINKYQQLFATNSINEFEIGSKETSNNDLQLLSIEILSKNGNGVFDINEEVTFRIKFTNHNSNVPVNLNLFFNTPDGVNIFAVCSPPQTFENKVIEMNCKIPANFLNDNIYNIEVMIVYDGKTSLVVKDALIIEGIEPEREGGWLGKFPGYVRPSFEWQIKN